MYLIVIAYIIIGFDYTVGPNQDLRVHMWCDVLCMYFGHRKQEKKLFLKNSHFWRLAPPKTAGNRKIGDFSMFLDEISKSIRDILNG